MDGGDGGDRESAVLGSALGLGIATHHAEARGLLLTPLLRCVPLMDIVKLLTILSMKVG